jgi:hypothetical protein
MKENVMLLQEINVLRKDAHELRQKIKLIGLLSGTDTTQRSLEASMRNEKEGMMNDLLKELKLQDI